MSGERNGYAPFKSSTPEPAPEPTSGAAMGVGLVVVAAIMFVIVTLGRGLLASLEEMANPQPPVQEPEPAPPDALTTPLSITLLRPVGELSEQAEAVESGIFSDTVVCTGRVRNAGGGGKLVVRVRTEYDAPERNPEKGEQVFTIINAGSSEPYRVELTVDNVKRHQPRFVHEVFVP